MVHTVCPYCGSGADMTPDMSDIAQWYAKHHPHLPVGSTVPEVCWDCYQQYEPGDQVVLRAEPDGYVFTVIGKITSPEQPELVVVCNQHGNEQAFAKSQIRRPVSHGGVKPDAKKEDGYF